MADLTGRCDCEAVTITVPNLPVRLTDCPCNYCIRTGVRWAYYPKDSISVTGPTQSYRRAARRLAFHRCAACGVLTHWWPKTIDWKNAGVNMRNFDSSALAGIPIGPPE